MLFLSHYGPFALWLIIGINVAVFAVMVTTFGAGDFTPRQVVEFGGTYGPLVLDRGENWRLVASNYIHFDLKHIAFNMFALFAWGSYVSERFGFARFAVFYTLCGVIGSWVSVTYQPNMVGAGASGAVSGVLAALFVFRAFGDRLISTKELLGALLFNAALSAFVPSIDWRAHAAGFVVGLIDCVLLILTLPRSNRLAAGEADRT